ncbi:unnamed protein product [Psylliodes chrysocephalus]|uniref:Uncharacterized protein n=1 Tax=Psylliodes chrysocephalus TaxID=3402493 RepID=A0A9P0CSF4_9CUCU|nr:unnamed protein product [Psylliodes chrysocephala]
MEIAIQTGTANKNEEDKRLKLELELHHRRAEAMSNNMKEEVKSVKQTNKKVLVIAFDLQQTLPTPSLTVGPLANYGTMATTCQGKKFKSIEHRFLVSGHTYLPCDRDFAQIEKHKRYLRQMYCPEDWFEAVRKSKRANPFEVIVMEQKDFLSFQKVPMVKKKT